MAVVRNMMVRVGADFSELINESAKASSRVKSTATSMTQGFSQIAASGGKMQAAPASVRQVAAELSVAGPRIAQAVGSISTQFANMAAVDKRSMASIGADTANLANACTAPATSMKHLSATYTQAFTGMSSASKQSLASIKGNLGRLDAPWRAATAQAKSGAAETTTAFQRLGAGAGAALDAARAKVTNFGASVKSTLSSLRSIVAPYVSVFTAILALKSVVNSAANAVEMQHLAEVAFGDHLDQAMQFASTAMPDYGLTGTQAKKYSANYMAMATSMGIANDAAADMSINVTKLAANVSSLFYIDQDTAYTKLRSIFTGTTKPLQELGVSMTEANLSAYALEQGITKSYSSMTQAEKVMLRYQYVMDALSIAENDYANTSTTWANQTKLLTNQFKSLGTSVGSIITTAFRPFLVGLNKVMSKVVSFANVVSTAFSAVFGTQATTVAATFDTDDLDDLTDSTSDYSDAADAAAGSAAALQRQLAGFDEITKLSDASSSSSGGSSGSAVGGAATSTSAATDSVIDQTQTKLGDFYDWLSGLNLKPISSAWDRLKDSFYGIADIVAGGFRWAWENVLKPFGSWSIEKGIPVTLDTIASGINAIAAASRLLAPAWQIAWDKVFVPLSEMAGETYISALTTIKTELDLLTQTLDDLYDLFNGEKTLGELFSDFFSLKGLGKSALTSLKTMLNLQKIVDKLFKGGQNQTFIDAALAAVDAAMAAIDNYTEDNPIIFQVDTSQDGRQMAQMTFAEWDAYQKQRTANLPVSRSTTGSQLFNATQAEWTGVARDLTVTPKTSKTGQQLANEVTTGFGSPVVKIAAATKNVLDVSRFLTGTTVGLTPKANSTLKTSALVSGTSIAINPTIKAADRLTMSQLIKPGTIKITTSSGGGGTSLGTIHATAYAKGGIVDGATLFGGPSLIGEMGAEAVMPLERNTGWMNYLAEQIVERMGIGDDSRPIEIHNYITLDGRVVGRSVVKYVNGEARRTGINPLAVAL